jgi:hypothetical protein
MSSDLAEAVTTGRTNPGQLIRNSFQIEYSQKSLEQASPWPTPAVRGKGKVQKS